MKFHDNHDNKAAYLCREINIRASVVKQGSDSVVAIMCGYMKRGKTAFRCYIGIMIVL